MTTASVGTECPIHHTFTLVTRCAHVGDAWIAEQLHGDGRLSILFRPSKRDDSINPWLFVFSRGDWDKYHQALMDGTLWTSVGAHDGWRSNEPL